MTWTTSRRWTPTRTWWRPWPRRSRRTSPRCRSARRAGRPRPGRPWCSPVTASCSPTRTWSGERPRAARPSPTAPRPTSTWWAPTRCPTSPWSAAAASTPPPAVLGDADVAAGRPAGRRGRQPARPRRLGHRRRGQRAGPVDADPLGPGRPGHRGRHPDRRGPEPGQLRRRAGRRGRPDRRHQHRGRRHRARPGRSGQRHHPPDHLRAAARRPGPPGLPRPGEHPGAAAGTARRPDRPAHGRCGSSRSSPGRPADRAGLRAGDLVLSAGRRPVADAQSLQRLLFAEAMGVPLPVTVLRNDAMVDVIAVPAELSRA